MARVKFGSLISGIRGSVGGVTFSAGRAGPYCKSWTRPGNPRSSLQNGHRQTFSTPGARWRALDQSARDDWDTWAALPAQEKTDVFGDPYYVSGWNWFVTFHNHAALSGATAPDAPPVAIRPTMPAITGATISTSPGAELVVTHAAGEFEDVYPIVGISLSPGNTQILPFPQIRRFFSAAMGGAADTSFIVSNIESKLGAVSAGQSFLISVALQTDESDRSAWTWLNGVTA